MADGREIMENNNPIKKIEFFPTAQQLILSFTLISSLHNSRMIGASLKRSMRLDVQIVSISIATWDSRVPSERSGMTPAEE
jgi:hypothetical protein